MAWTDISAEAPDSTNWNSFGNIITSNTVRVYTGTEFYASAVRFPTVVESIWTPQSLDQYNVPGFDGFSPVVAEPIANNIDTPQGGGSVRPSSGFIYPRGDG